MSGDEDDFNAFVAARFTALARTAYLLTGNRHDAEDLVQIALAKGARQWRRIRHRPEPYVRQIMYHENISRWRRRRPVEVTTDASPERQAPYVDVAAKVVLRQALQRLTPAQRTVLILRYYEDLTEAQTAAVMDIAVGTVKSQTRHALARLRVLAPDLVELVNIDS